MLKLQKMFEQDTISTGALKIIETLNGKRKKCYLVGGSVRDLLLKKQPKEWDLATDALPNDVMSLFDKVVPTGIKYGTVTVIFDNETYEVTTFRKDEKYLDGRHPENVKFTLNLQDDLSRRDFTINAMALNPITEEFVDLFSGQEDLVAGIIRAVGDPIERFREDGLRPIRACRFAAQLDFEIEEKTLAAISKTLDVTKMVSIERVHDEIIKALASPRPSIFFDYMRDTGLMQIFIPELAALHGVEQPSEFHKHDVYWHSLYSCDAAPSDNLIVRLAALFHDIGKPSCKDGLTFYNHDQVGAEITENLMRRLKFSNENIKSVTNLISNHMFNYESNWSDSAVRRFLKRVGLENVQNIFLLRRADMEGMGTKRNYAYLSELQERIEGIIKEEQAIHVMDLKIKGSDIMQFLQIPPGPKVGQILNEILEKVLDDPSLNEKHKLLELLSVYKT